MPPDTVKSDINDLASRSGSRFRILLAMIYYRRHLHEGVAAYCREHGWALDSLDHSPNLRTSNLWDGIIVLHPELPDLKLFFRKGVPVVTLALDERGQMQTPCVYQDHPAIGTMGARHLLERGFRRLLFCGYRDVVSRQRFEGFRREAERHQATVKAIFLSHRTSRATGQNGIFGWLSVHFLRERPPFAIMAAHDLLGLTVMDACQMAGLKIPEQVAVVGVDNEEIICECANIPLSSVDNNLFLHGYTAAELLGQVISGEKSSGASVVIPPRRVIIRSSSDIIATRDSRLSGILQYLHDQEHNSSISVKDISSRFGLSRRALTDLFLKAGLQAPGSVIREVRLRQACFLLEESDNTVNEVARQTGFSSARSFCRFFRNKKGCSPAAWRQKAKS
jgi:LacI family transcriptional regulator